MATAGAWLTRRDLVAQTVPAQSAPGQSAAPSHAEQTQAAANTNPAVQPNPDLPQQLRTAAANEKIKTTKLTDTIFLLQGVGGNIVCQTGPDGKVLIDSGISTGTDHLRDALSKLDEHHLKLLINTHWHFDHTDGNAALHLDGALIIAQDNTRKYLSEVQRVEDWDYNFLPPAPGGTPTETFADALDVETRRRLVSVGRYALRGVVQPQELFTPEPGFDASELLL